MVESELSVLELSLTIKVHRIVTTPINNIPIYTQMVKRSFEIDHVDDPTLSSTRKEPTEQQRLLQLKTSNSRAPPPSDSLTLLAGLSLVQSH